VDEIDRGILYHLQQNARIANNDLAGAVGLSPSPCLRRVRQLEASGAIRGYTAVIDPSVVGRGFEPIVWVTLTEVTRESMDRFETAIHEVPDIVEASRMMGQPDYLLRVAVRDADEFESLYMDTLARLPGVKTLTSQTAMKVVKRTVAPIRTAKDQPVRRR
jgi:DNA-binding Lrp family transcriptional regulator